MKPKCIRMNSMQKKLQWLKTLCGYIRNSYMSVLFHTRGHKGQCYLKKKEELLLQRVLSV